MDKPSISCWASSRYIQLLENGSYEFLNGIFKVWLQNGRRFCNVPPHRTIIMLIRKCQWEICLKDEIVELRIRSVIDNKEGDWANSINSPST